MNSPAPKPAPTLAELDAAALAACEVRAAANAAAVAWRPALGYPIRFHPQASAILDAIGKVTREAIDRYLDAANAARQAPAPEPAKPRASRTRKPKAQP